MLNKIRLFLVIVLVGLVGACEPDPDPTNDPPITSVEAASRFQSCLQYMEVKVTGVNHFVNRYEEQTVVLELGRPNDWVRMHGVYGLGRDRGRIARIAYAPFSQSARRTGGSVGRIVNVRFISEDSIGNYPKENLCPLTEAAGS
jgi:hypothetical protein